MNYRVGMDDREVVAAIATGDPTGVAVAYDKGAPGLYSYCQFMLRGPADATEALRDTFVIAASTLGDLLKPPSLRPWLYAVARRECQRRLRTTPVARSEDDNAANWPTYPADEWVNAADEPIDATQSLQLTHMLNGQAIDATQPIPVVRMPTDEVTDAAGQFRAVPQFVDTASQDGDAGGQFGAIRQPIDAPDRRACADDCLSNADLRMLVRSVVAGLAPGEREVIELNLRHDLDNADLAMVLGMPLGKAGALTARARGKLEKALGVLLIARTGREACPALHELLADWDGQLDKLTANRVGTHLEHCQTCVADRWDALRPVAQWGLPPLAAVPPELRLQVLRLCTGTTADAVAYRQRVARRAEESGWPAPSGKAFSWDSIRANPGRAIAAAAVALWVLAAVIVLTVIFLA